MASFCFTARSVSHPTVRCPSDQEEGQMFDFTSLHILSVLTFCLLNVSTGDGLCPADELQCDANKCISKHLRCDGVVHCEDRTDEINCDMNETTRNARNDISSANDTTPLSNLLSNITTQPLTHQPTHSKPTQSTPPVTKRKSKKFKRKRVSFDNGTKRRIKRPYHYKKIPPWSAKLLSTMTVDTKSTKGTPISMHCSAQECRKWKACWHNVKRLHKCACDEVTCSREWKRSAHTRAGNEKDSGLKDVFEWVAISLSSTGLFLAIIVLLVKRRRLRHNNIRPLHVRTVVCYHNGQEDCACVVSGTAAEIRPLCEKAGSPSLVARQEGSVCYINYNGQVKGDR